jgi:hypothetical protein
MLRAVEDSLPGTAGLRDRRCFHLGHGFPKIL